MSDLQNEIRELDERVNTLRAEKSIIERQKDSILQQLKKDKADFQQRFPDVDLKKISKEKVEQMVEVCKKKLLEAEKVVAECKDLLDSKDSTDLL